MSKNNEPKQDVELDEEAQLNKRIELISTVTSKEFFFILKALRITVEAIAQSLGVSTQLIYATNKRTEYVAPFIINALIDQLGHIDDFKMGRILYTRSTENGKN